MTAVTKKPQAETRRFGMNPKLLLDVIKRQAGTLAKAVLEGVMNSIDAKCTVCHITLEAGRVVVEDDGTGITERGQIEQFFETFGTPHTEAEGKRYGTFRMGRGQMFAYGRNAWRTGPFAMDVDIKRKGLDYELTEGLADARGCSIQIHLYDPLLPSDLAETERLVKHLVKYAPGEVTLNGKRINIDPAAETWEIETDEAYIKLSRGKGTLSVYNLGVHVNDYYSGRFGIGGVVVTKQQLEVNFARNDVQSTCRVWRKIKPLIDQRAQSKMAKKTVHNDAERQRLADLICQGEYPEGAKDLKLFTAADGRHYSADQLATKASDYNRKLAVAPPGNRAAIRAFEQKLAFVLSQETRERFGDKTAEELVRVVEDISGGQYHHYRKHQPDWKLYEVVDWQSLQATINEQYDLLAEADLSVIEKVWLDVARCGFRTLSCNDYEDGSRKVAVGESEVADAWTDGLTYVALSRRFLRSMSMTAAGVTRVAMTLLHVACHDAPDTGEHEHGPEFYERFHEGTLELLPPAVEDMLRRLPDALEIQDKALKRSDLRNADRDARTLRTLQSIVTTVERRQALETKSD